MEHLLVGSVVLIVSIALGPLAMIVCEGPGLQFEDVCSPVACNRIPFPQDSEMNTLHTGRTTACNCRCSLQPSLLPYLPSLSSSNMKHMLVTILECLAVIVIL